MLLRAYVDRWLCVYRLQWARLRLLKAWLVLQFWNGVVAVAERVFGR